jgi:hypothetical protein
MKSMVSQILAIEHYPKDIFIPMTREQLDKRIEAFKYAGLSPDQEAGHLMRIAEYNTKTEAVKIMDDFLAESLTPYKIHEWYLEACKRVKPKNFNPKAQKPYEELNEEQRFIDRFIVNKIFDMLLGGKPRTTTIIARWNP